MRNLIVFLCLLFSGCVWTQDYPADWPALDPVTEACPDIAGSFAETGRTSDRPWLFMDSAFKPSASLTYELLYVEYRGDTPVEIAQPNANTIIVTAIDATGSANLHSFDRDEGDFRCDEGKIWFPAAGAAALAKWVAKTGFSKATDGSLVAEDHTVDVNGKSIMFYLWPVFITVDKSTN